MAKNMTAINKKTGSQKTNPKISADNFGSSEFLYRDFIKKHNMRVTEINNRQRNEKR